MPSPFCSNPNYFPGNRLTSESGACAQPEPRAANGYAENLWGWLPPKRPIFAVEVLPCRLLLHKYHGVRRKSCASRSATGDDCGTSARNGLRAGNGSGCAAGRGGSAAVSRRGAAAAGRSGHSHLHRRKEQASPREQRRRSGWRCGHHLPRRLVRSRPHRIRRRHRRRHHDRPPGDHGSGERLRIEASRGTVNLRTQTGKFYDVSGSVGMRRKLAAGVTLDTGSPTGNKGATQVEAGRRSMPTAIPSCLPAGWW